MLKQDSNLLDNEKDDIRKFWKFSIFERYDDSFQHFQDDYIYEMKYTELNGESFNTDLRWKVAKKNTVSLFMPHLLLIKHSIFFPSNLFDQKTIWNRKKN